MPTWWLFSFDVGSKDDFFIVGGLTCFLLVPGHKIFCHTTVALSVWPRCVLFFVAVTTVCFGNFQRGEGLTIGVACLDLRFSVFGTSGGTFGALASGCVLL